MADHLADLLLAPTPAAMAHLAREGLADRAELVGDVMVDAHAWAARARRPRVSRPCAREHDQLRAAHPPPCRERRRPGSARARSSTAWPFGCRSSSPSIRAPARALERAGLALPAERRRPSSRSATWRWSRSRRRADGDRHRFGRRPEGGVPVGRPVHHAARRDRVGRDRRGRLEPRRRRRSDGARPRPWPTRRSCDRGPPATRRCTATEQAARRIVAALERQHDRAQPRARPQEAAIT